MHDQHRVPLPNQGVLDRPAFRFNYLAAQAVDALAGSPNIPGIVIEDDHDPDEDYKYQS